MNLLLLLPCSMPLLLPPQPLMLPTAASVRCSASLGIHLGRDAAADTYLHLSQGCIWAAWADGSLRTTEHVQDSEVDAKVVSVVGTLMFMASGWIVMLR